MAGSGIDFFPQCIDNLYNATGAYPSSPGLEAQFVARQLHLRLLDQLHQQQQQQLAKQQQGMPRAPDAAHLRSPLTMEQLQISLRDDVKHASEAFDGATQNADATLQARAFEPGKLQIDAGPEAPRDVSGPNDRNKADWYAFHWKLEKEAKDLEHQREKAKWQQDVADLSFKLAEAQRLLVKERHITARLKKQIHAVVKRVGAPGTRSLSALLVQLGITTNEIDDAHMETGSPDASEAGETLPPHLRRTVYGKQTSIPNSQAMYILGPSTAVPLNNLPNLYQQQQTTQVPLYGQPQVQSVHAQNINHGAIAPEWLLNQLHLQQAVASACQVMPAIRL